MLSAFGGSGLYLELHTNSWLDIDLGHQPFVCLGAESIEQEIHHTILSLLVEHVDVVLQQPLHQSRWISDLRGHSWQLAYHLRITW